MQSPKSKNQEYQGIQPYKAIAPLVYTIFGVIYILGPFLFNKIYQEIVLTLLGYSLIRMVMMFVQGSIGISNVNKLIKKIQYQKYQKIDISTKINQHIYHAIVIPNYNEEEHLLDLTLKNLAQHSIAKDSYIIFLGMEQFQEDCQLKAKRLVAKHKNNFKIITYTIHQLQQNEDRMKASNSNWCLQHMKQIIQTREQQFDFNNLYVTIVDADSTLHEQYFKEINQNVLVNSHKKHKKIFCSPQIFNKNHMEIPGISRAIEQLHSSNVYFNLSSLVYELPMSNYSASYNLFQQVGFIDTCLEAIGEDTHFVIKCHWKRNGDIITVPIFVPSIQHSLSTGLGTVADIKAKFWQIERHGLGVCDVAYSIKMFKAHKISLKNIIVTLMVLEMMMMPVIATLGSISLMISSLIIPEKDLIISIFQFNILFNLFFIIQLISYLKYIWYKRICVDYFYKEQNQSWFRLINYFIWSNIAYLVLFIPAFAYAGFHSYFSKKRIYTVSKKNMKNKPIQSQNDILIEPSPNQLHFTCQTQPTH